MKKCRSKCVVSHCFVSFNVERKNGINLIHALIVKESPSKTHFIFAWKQ